MCVALKSCQGKPVSYYLNGVAWIEITHNSNALRRNNAQSETSPHEQEREELPRGVQNPLPEERHERRAEGIQDDENNRHDDAVAQDQCSRVRITAPSDAAVVIVELLFTEKRVRAVGYRTLRQVEHPLIVRVVVLDSSVGIGAADGISLLPRRDPVCAVAIQTHSPARPGAAVPAPHVGDHSAVIVQDTAAFEELELGNGVVARHRVPDTRAPRDRYVARSVRVHDEDVGVGHGFAGPEGDPRV